LKRNRDKAQRAIRVASNKAKNELHRKGVDARKAERERKKKIQALQSAREPVPEDLLIPIRDPEKDPTPEELESLKLHPALIPIDPELLGEQSTTVVEDESEVEFILECQEEEIRSRSSCSDSETSDDSWNADFLKFDY
jgi:hypothetical protein